MATSANSQDTKSFLPFQVFTEDSITVPTLESTFCNWKTMAFEPFRGHIREVLGDEGLRRGRMLKMWPPKGNGERGGYSPEMHQCPEQEVMNK